MDQEDGAGLGAQGQDMPGPVVLLVFAGAFVFEDDVPIVLVDRTGGDESVGSSSMIIGADEIRRSKLEAARAYTSSP
jgi:hypothetical protein